MSSPRDYENAICKAPDLPRTWHSPGLTMGQCERGRKVRQADERIEMGQRLIAVQNDHRVQLEMQADDQEPQAGAPEAGTQYQRQFPKARDLAFAAAGDSEQRPDCERLPQSAGPEPAIDGYEPSTAEAIRAYTTGQYSEPIPEPVESVNHPAHYGGADDPYEVIKVCEAWGLDEDAYLFNVIKYVARPGKGDYLTDLRKARFYLSRRIAKMEKLKGGGS